METTTVSDDTSIPLYYHEPDMIDAPTCAFSSQQLIDPITSKSDVSMTTKTDTADGSQQYESENYESD